MQSSIDLRAPFSYNILPIIIGIIFIIIISIYFFVKNKSKNEKIIGIDKRKELGELNIKEIKKKYINKLDKLKLSVENENIGLREGYQKHLNGNSDISDEIIADMENRFHQAINDDMNMPLALSVVWEAVKYPEKSPKIAQLLKKFDTVLGIKIDEVQETKIPQEILDLVEERKQARSDKNWSESDRLRDLIAEKGYIVKDTKDVTEVLKK